jgi:protein-S-isoprenylcysteine O-methyltransferase Ste14
MNIKHGLLHLGLTLAIFLGLPLLGWGLTDLQGFFSDQGRAGFVLFTLLGACLAAYQGMIIPESRGLPAKRITRQTVFLIVFAVLGGGLLIALPFCDHRSLAVMGENTGLRIWGATLLAVGGTIMFWSVMDLGKQYSPEVTLQNEHQLVTTGWYQHLRHPRYLGLIIMVLGFALVFRAWVGLAAVVLVSGALVWRISDEEKMLHQEFGERWETYCQHTCRLIPRLW